MNIRVQPVILCIACLVFFSSFNSNPPLPILQPVAQKDFNYISSKFGWRKHPIRQNRQFHSGIDIVTKHKNAKVFATADGIVKELDYSKEGLGLFVILEHSHDFETVYAHLSDIKVLKGSSVRAGEWIARMGTTGSSTAEHLHYEIRHDGMAIDPIEVIERLKK